MVNVNLNKPPTRLNFLCSFLRIISAIEISDVKVHLSRRF